MEIFVNEQGRWMLITSIISTNPCWRRDVYPLEIEHRLGENPQVNEAAW
ncbi:hypothetical protein [Halobacillus naozhouensis]|uniref:Uncharacterized protein n=1 Tax=Halobacillus naozhouensis TaxID=554880 RepID=A0ABY8J6W4_9BACI|nr:hypothetical protein [Halobacillus naozhouensis]WFT76505.1 hypothetical protein P9989_09135 [Halobacillus naozhouensis]